MAKIRLPQLVTPIVAMLAREKDWFAQAKAPLEAMFGPVELESPLYPFDRSVYYTPTMGSGLKRQFFSFRNLADPAALVDWKLATIALEAKLGQDFRSIYPDADLPERPINLDAGYLTSAKLVLASTKDFAHRIYLRDGIFAEITLSYRVDAWTSHYFTFPDFRCGTYHHYFKRLRDRHMKKTKHFGRDMSKDVE
jgi:hypothetical protein